VTQGALRPLPPEHVEIERCRADALAQRRGVASERDAMWTSVAKKPHPRWRWPAMAPHSGKGGAYVLGRRQDSVFFELQRLLTPWGITRFDTDGWGGAYERPLTPEQHVIGQQHTQKSESQPIHLRTRIKRLGRRTSGCSKTPPMPNLVVGLFLNRYEFGRAISHGINSSGTPSLIL
jgi:insertion element IS1 protein InsB